MAILTLYPWLNPCWEELSSTLAQGRLPHALLLVGLPGMGKAALAEYLARFLLCEQPAKDTAPCNTCGSCRLFQAGTHPDFFPISPGEDSTVIKIDQIRALTGGLSLSAHQGGHKVVILNPAEAMNMAAANSLLKTLEEPTDNTVLVLLSAQPARLPATIRSRCQRVRIEPAGQGAALEWLAGQIPAQDAEMCLKLASGAPLRALELAEEKALERRRAWLLDLAGMLDGSVDPVAAAQEWSRDADLQAVRWLGEWLMDMLRIRLTGQTGEVRSIDLIDTLQPLAGKLDTRVMFRQLDRVNRAMRLATSSLNRQLMTEDILLAWTSRL